MAMASSQAPVFSHFRSSFVQIRLLPAKGPWEIRAWTAAIVNVDWSAAQPGNVSRIRGFIRVVSVVMSYFFPGPTLSCYCLWRVVPLRLVSCWCTLVSCMSVGSFL